MSKQTKTWILLGILIGILMTLVFYPIPQGGDTDIYIAIARNLLAGKGFTEDGIAATAQVPPLYPLFLALALYLAPIHYVLLVHFIQFAILGGIAAVIYFLTRRIFGASRVWATLAGLTVLFWPYFLLYSTLLLTEVPYTLLLIGAVTTFLIFLKDKHIGYAMGSGLLIGAALQIRPVVVFFPFWMVLAALLVRAWRTRAHLKGLSIFLLLFLLMQAPWLMRNERVFGSPLPTTNIGVVVWKGLNITDWKTFSTGGVDTSPPDPNAPRDEKTRDKVALQEATNQLKKNPLRALRLAGKKAILFWDSGAGGTYAAYAKHARGFGTIALAIYRIIFFVILGVALLGIVLRRDRYTYLLTAVILYFWILHSLLFPYPRYTLPVLPLVFALAARGLHALFWSTRRDLVVSPSGGDVPKDLAVSVIVPAHNEANTLGSVIHDLIATLPTLTARHEIIVVNDGSTDDTQDLLGGFKDRVRIVQHEWARGYGASIKHGASLARMPYLVFFDADGQHRARELGTLFGSIGDAAMVIGTRPQGGDAGWQRKWGKALIRAVVEFLVRAKVPDFNSGFRVVRRDIFLRYAHLFPNGFSLSTTSTVALLHEGHPVRFVSVSSYPRASGASTVGLRDGFKTLYTATRLVLLFAPLRVMFPIAVFFFLVFLGFFAYDLANLNISNTSVLLLLGSIIFFFFGALMDLVTTMLREPPQRGRDI